MAVAATDAWFALQHAGVQLEEAHDGLTLAMPKNLEVTSLVALGRAAGAHLFPLASARWRTEIAGWPDTMRDAWEERAAIREADGGQTREQAERMAFLEVRERVLAPHTPLLETLTATLGAVLLSVQASTTTLAREEGSPQGHAFATASVAGKGQPVCRGRSGEDT